MSITAFKRKSIIQFGSNVSGKGPGGYWVPQGPFGKSTLVLENVANNVGPSGFSLNGGRRNVGYVGQNMCMSKNGTPFKGIYPRGSGGVNNTYPSPQPVMNACDSKIFILGNQADYIKQSVLSTKGMLEKKYRWAYNGQYPNVWVQPNYGTSNLSDNTSQGVYIHTLASANSCVIDVNNQAKYIGNIKSCGAKNLIGECRSEALKGEIYVGKLNLGLYTKNVKVPITSDQYTTYIQRKCANPKPSQKPFPYAVNGDASCSAPPQLLANVAGIQT